MPWESFTVPFTLGERERERGKEREGEREDDKNGERGEGREERRMRRGGIREYKEMMWGEVEKEGEGG